MFVSSSLGHPVRSATFTKSQVLHPGIEGTEEVRTQDATAAFTQEMEVETRIATETRERPGGSCDRWGGFFHVGCWMPVKDFRQDEVSSSM